MLYIKGFLKIPIFIFHVDLMHNFFLDSTRSLPEIFIACYHSAGTLSVFAPISNSTIGGQISVILHLMKNIGFLIKKSLLCCHFFPSRIWIQTMKCVSSLPRLRYISWPPVLVWSSTFSQFDRLRPSKLAVFPVSDVDRLNYLWRQPFPNPRQLIGTVPHLAQC
jgi:hypothetical protein